METSAVMRLKKGEGRLLKAGGLWIFDNEIDTIRGTFADKGISADKGLVVDKFADVLVVQSLALGIDRYKETIIGMLKTTMAEDGITIRGVYERSDAKEREKEGMDRVMGFLGEEFDTRVSSVENGVEITILPRNLWHTHPFFKFYS